MRAGSEERRGLRAPGLDRERHILVDHSKQSIHKTGDVQKRD